MVLLLWGCCVQVALLAPALLRRQREGGSTPPRTLQHHEPQLALGGQPSLVGTQVVCWGVMRLCSRLFADAPLPEKEILYPAEPARATLPSGGPFHVCSPPAGPATAPLSPASLGKTEPLSILSRNATHPLLHISTLYEAREEEEGGPRAPPDVGSLITIPPPQQILIATFDEPRTVVSTVEF